MGQWKDFSRERREELQFRFVDVPSQKLFEICRDAARIKVFLQSPDELLGWCNRLDKHLKDELLLHGLARILGRMRLKPTAGTAASLLADIARHTARTNSGAQKIREKARQFGRIVEMLDAHMVDGQLLGDCTKGDLLRAASAAEAVAGEATMNAQFYRLLAGMLPEHGVTVRQANNRKEVVALLTATFREAA